jgi:hypothetical protein
MRICYNTVIEIPFVTLRRVDITIVLQWAFEALRQRALLENDSCSDKIVN